MKINHGYPPNIARIRETFGAQHLDNAVYTYGDTLYVPQGVEVSEHLQAHEIVHTRQQSDPVAWWDRYLVDPQFRLEQEVEAYRAQWQFLLANVGRQQRRDILKHISKHLSGPLYGRIISTDDAKKAITA